MRRLAFRGSGMLLAVAGSTRVLLEQAEPPAAPAKVIPGQEDFVKYNEIDNPSPGRIAEFRKHDIARDEWIATEKVHGANFGLYMINHGKVMKFAKRTMFLPDHENFFGYHVLIPEMSKHAREVHRLVCEWLGKEVHTVIINGELFGGKYTHPSVPKSSKTFKFRGMERPIAMVQSNPFPQYSPDLHFIAFDIKYRVNEGDEPVILTYDQGAAIFSKVQGLLWTKALLRGPLDKLLAFDVNNFVTTIPGLLGLGNFPLDGNISEGVVIRHSRRGDPEFERQNAEAGRTVATVIKVKTAAFTEFSHPENKSAIAMLDSLHQQAVATAGLQVGNADAFMPELEAAASDVLVAHICENRLRGMISKTGYDCYKNGEVTPDQLAVLLAKDALKDFLKEASPTIINTNITFRKQLAHNVILASKKYVEAVWPKVLTESV